MASSAVDEAADRMTGKCALHTEKAITSWSNTCVADSEEAVCARHSRMRGASRDE